MSPPGRPKGEYRKAQPEGGLVSPPALSVAGARVAIVLLNWNNGRDTVNCLESVLRLQGVPFTVVVCDNQSTDDSLALMRAWAANGSGTGDVAGPLGPPAAPLPRPVAWQEWQHRAGEPFAADQPIADHAVHLVHTGGNLGFAGGCNVGMRWALQWSGCSHVWLLNNDTVVHPDALARLLARAEAADHPDMVGSLLVYHDEPQRIQCLGGGRLHRRSSTSSHLGEGLSLAEARAASGPAVEAQMDYVVGASLLVRRDFIARVGLLEEDYFLYYEELDWAERGRRSAQGLRLGFAPDSLVYHKVGATAGTHRRSCHSLRYLYRSRLMYTRRFARAMLPAVRLAALWDATKLMLKGRPDAASAVLSAATARLS